jgi:hypothetical protein
VSGARRGERERGTKRTADFFLVSFENAEFFHGADVEYSHGLVTGGTRYEVAVG